MNSITREEALLSVWPGWSELINEAYDLFENDGTVNVIQVKEKFGGLRIYFEGGYPGYPSMLNMIDELEYRSYYICEECGESGVLRNRSWVKTLCDKHCDGAPPLLPRNSPTDQYDLFGADWGIWSHEYK